MGLSECGNYTAGIKAIAGAVSGGQPRIRGRILQRRRAIRFDRRDAARRVHRHEPRMASGFPDSAVVGLLWLLPWLAVFRRRHTPDPRAAPAPPGQALAVSASAKLIRNRKVLGLFLIRVFSGPITTLYWFWLPLYLRTGRAMSFAMIGVLGWLPNLFGMSAQRRRRTADGSAGGDHRIDRSWTKLAFSGAFGLSALSMAMPFVANDYVALALMGLALFGNQWVAATYIGTVGDVVPHEVAGRVNGLAGFGDSSSVLSPSW